MDQLNKVLLAAAVLLWGVSRFLTGGLRVVLFYLFLLVAGICLYRVLSLNQTKRRAENDWFQRWIEKVRNGPETMRNRREQRAEYKIFKCPGCGAKMRVPRGEGKIRVTCRQCGTVFEMKS